ncbi:MAG: hypothetical protein A2725_02580 [Candidatus Magasanikbacteria bacterium RIFCSPHIGHO2_01_FULL_33_34]|uniref:Methyltransferase type 11 domain-containing protein n=1 Tax=Candidatus Magasanikbacteria bacterium RIFCSPHIGHO2_01_FULL_33_34 TaxID=1798671 RepID=A0A1F6LKI8_9BACT|nr:MAG: hypothetical protein A2725_02580 [Candidatus Magasanikbacteria bacterium RIFCSPHIGHO2_01_FULL_33_34]OGH65595.1 MAG: hypothetical protein A3B83_01820 [Candidatus Magasanikbacteria bacterium RIFCSPHIGHO2_02_FULL_33_17]OGH75804.1 MAG: hypothetical protein A3A89_02715 [Candidatus Magasanikbacteria bacterium RIFCSPLOWO2_01_FULL_33_34]OGH81340.1 MAG: hypothetical protein A3F93_02135 [Candidatus Magasanikbacteria bacterium RIFCSPLOWO2_12_FULL_34_7]
MTLSQYHQQYTNQTNEKIQKKADIKKQELITIFNQISFNLKSRPIKLAVLGCGDKRFINHHKKIFKNILKKNIEVSTFDITIDHLDGESNVFQHDCTLPLPNTPYDITYAHVLLKFIEPKKQFDLVKNSFDALKPGGIAIHVLDKEECEATKEKLSNGLWAVSVNQLTKKLSKLKIEYKKITIEYGLAIVLLQK